MNNKERYVGVFDILGISALTCKNQLRAIETLKIFQDIIVNHVGKLAIQVRDTNEIIIDRLEKILFSDTVVIFTKEKSRKDLHAMILLCSELFSQSLHKCIPIRGGIAVGNLFCDNKTGIICGCPLVKAHELEKKSKWLGISVTDDVAQEIKNANIQAANQESSVVGWKLDKTTRNVINWPAAYKNNFTVPLPITVEQFYEGFKNYSGDYSTLNDSIKEKYLNTVAFINSRLCGINESL